MKILIIQPWLSYRGAESISIDEAQGLRRLGHGAAILCLFLDRKRLRKEALDLDFILPPHFIARFCQRSNIFFFLFGFFILVILTLWHGKKFDVYNPHNFPSYWVAALAALLYRKPVYWTVHNFPQHGFTNPLASRIWERLTWGFDQAMVRRITDIVAVSDKVGQQVNQYYKRKATVIRPPVDFDFFSRGRKRLLGKRLQFGRRPMVLIASKLHEVKNPMLALRAIKRLVKKKRKMVFVFAGEGPMLPQLRTYCRENQLTRQVMFAGFVPKESLRHLYKRATLVFLPGFFGEGFNVTVLEALAVATPSLVLKGSGIDQWLVKYRAGFVVEPSGEKIAQKMADLIGDQRLLRSVGKRGKGIVEKEHATEKYAEKLIKEFR